MNDHIETLRAAAAYWRGRTRPEHDRDPGEVSVSRLYGDDWIIHVCSLDGARLLERLAEWQPEAVKDVRHSDAGTRVIVERRGYTLHSGVRRPSTMTDEQRAAASERLKEARNG